MMMLESQTRREPCSTHTHSYINPKMNLCSTGTCLRLPLGVSQPFVGTVEKFVSLPAALLERITYIFQSTVEVWS